MLYNFFSMIRIFGALYLASTQDKRGSFWYRPNTDSENKIDDFESELIVRTLY
jgi:hypothetical protein